jgi:hypothetical protein
VSAAGVAGAARRARGWLAVALVAALLTGLVLGWRLGADTQARAPGYLEQLTADLGLRPDQVASIESILAEEDRAIDALLQQQIDGIRAQVAERRQQTEQAVVQRLDERQRGLYAQLSAPR